MFIFHFFIGPSVLPFAVPRRYTGQQTLIEANRTFAQIIENPCRRRNELFNRSGLIRRIDILIREQTIETNLNDGKEKSEITFY